MLAFVTPVKHRHCRGLFTMMSKICKSERGKHQCQAVGSKMHDAGEFSCVTCLKLFMCGASHKTSFWRNSRMSGEPFSFLSLCGDADNEQKSLATWLAMLSTSTPPSHKTSHPVIWLFLRLSLNLLIKGLERKKRGKVIFSHYIKWNKSTSLYRRGNWCVYHSSLIHFHCDQKLIITSVVRLITMPPLTVFGVAGVKEQKVFNRRATF